MGSWQSWMISLARNEPIKNFMQSRATTSKLSRQFVAGKTMKDTIERIKLLKKQSIDASLFYLGEYVEDIKMIEETIQALEKGIQELSKNNLDTHISIDPTQIGLLQSDELCGQNLLYLANIINKYKDHNNIRKDFLMIDMEDSSITEQTIEFYKLLKENSLPVALTLQTYLYRTLQDIELIIQNGDPVRIVKGAFTETSLIAYTNKKEKDQAYLQCAKHLLSREAKQNGVYPIFATHDDKMIDTINTIAEQNGWQKDQYEFEMLLGVRETYQKKLVSQGYKVRLYTPFGKDWWAYAVRRIGENPKNFKMLLLSIFKL